MEANKKNQKNAPNKCKIGDEKYRLRKLRRTKMVGAGMSQSTHLWHSSFFFSCCCSAISSLITTVHPGQTFHVTVLQFAVFVARKIVEFGPFVREGGGSDVESVVSTANQIAHPDLWMIQKMNQFVILITMVVVAMAIHSCIYSSLNKIYWFKTSLNAKK